MSEQLSEVRHLRFVSGGKCKAVSVAACECGVTNVEELKVLTPAMYTEIHQSKKIHCIVYIVCPSLSVSTQCRGTEGSDSNAQTGARSHDLRIMRKKRYR